MARYFFHNAVDGSPLGDDEGEELTGIEAAQNAAIDILSEVLPCRREAFNDEKRFSVNVKDDTGRLIISITTTMTVDPSSEPGAPPQT